jgi:CheY-like chemotaxis protein
MVPSESGPKVLVVDDDDAIRMMVERVLKREKYHVDCARDGQEAIEKLDQSRYDTVLLDLMMPRIDGHGVIRFLEKRKGGPLPQVIVMTANVQGAAESVAARPVFRILSKPFDISQLITHVRESAKASTPSETSG